MILLSYFWQPSSTKVDEWLLPKCQHNQPNVGWWRNAHVTLEGLASHSGRSNIKTRAKMEAGCEMTENLIARYNLKILWWEKDFLILMEGRGKDLKLTPGCRMNRKSNIMNVMQRTASLTGRDWQKHSKCGGMPRSSSNRGQMLHWKSPC